MHSLQSLPPDNKHPPSLLPVLIALSQLPPCYSRQQPPLFLYHPALLTLDLGQLCAQRCAVAVQAGQQLVHLRVGRV